MHLRSQKHPAVCFIILALLVITTAGCSPIIKEAGPVVQSPEFHIDNKYLVMADGTPLPLHTWMPDSPDAIVLALHGFNDYGAFFEDFAVFLNQHNIGSYAYDQRGFGSSTDAGYWAGRDAYVEDAKTALDLIRARHPGVPVFCFGESMGGAVLMAAASEEEASPLEADGLILAAPASWGRETMPWYQTTLLWFAVHTMPGVALSGRGLNITPSDNIEMLRALGRDPLVIKDTRVDALWGVVNLMDRALDSARNFHARSLILYGERDEIIEKQPTQTMLDRLPDLPKENRTIATYENGYHMLIRDLEAKIVWNDILAWIKNSDITVLPSGGELRAEDFVTAMGQ